VNAAAHQPAPTGHQLTGHRAPDGGLRLLCVSARDNACHLVGHTSMHPVDPVPDGAGTVFATICEITAYVRRQVSSVSSYSQVRVIDSSGTVIAYGVRAGYNSTGHTWIWRPA
jgi:hypothetical protein